MKGMVILWGICSCFSCVLCITAYSSDVSIQQSIILGSFLIFCSVLGNALIRDSED